MTASMAAGAAGLLRAQPIDLGVEFLGEDLEEVRIDQPLLQPFGDHGVEAPLGPMARQTACWSTPHRPSTGCPKTGTATDAGKSHEAGRGDRVFADRHPFDCLGQLRQIECMAREAALLPAVIAGPRLLLTETRLLA